MKVYVAIDEDRHLDPQIEVFTTADAAIAYARQEAKPQSKLDHYEEREVGDCLFFAEYSVEGDCVWVVEKELRS